MFRATWKSLMGRKVRLLLSALSIVLGVAFVSGSLIFTSLLSDSLDEIIQGTLADVNVLPEGQGSPFSTPDTTQPVTSETLDAIRDVDGVVAAEGIVSSASVYPMDRDGNLMAFGGAPGMATNFIDLPAADGQAGARLVDGSLPETADQVAVDPATLSRGGYALGEIISVVTPFDGIQEYTISGVATWGGGATAGASYLFLTTDEMQRLALDGRDQFTGAWIQADLDRDVEAIAARVQDVLPSGLEAISGAAMAEDVQEQLDVGLGFVNTFLLIFAAIALVVATLMILNTFSILVAQRSRELALLRAIGAKPRQVRHSVLLEALVVGLVGATMGIAAGYALAWAITLVMDQLGVGLGETEPRLTWQAIVASYAVAVVITAVAAWIPARRASRTRPVEAMSRAAGAGRQQSAIVPAIGLALIQLGIGAVVVGLVFDLPGPAWWVGAGCAGILVGAVMAASVLGRPIVWLFGKAYRLVFGEIGKLAGRNATRQPGRTAATAATLMIGLTLVSTVAILAATTTESFREGVTQDQRGDFVATPVNFRPFDAAVSEAMSRVDGVGNVWTWSSGAGSFDGTGVVVTGMSPDTLANGAAITVLGGDLNADGNTVMMDFETSRELGLEMGQSFELVGISREPETVLLAGLYDQEHSSTPVGEVIVNEEYFPLFGDPRLIDQAVISLADGADPDRVLSDLREAASQSPIVAVSSNAEYAESLVGQFDVLVGVIYGLLALAVVISVLGIINTLGLSVIERTREIGLLRAVGMTRRQLRRMVGLESVIVAMLGSMLGVVLGLAFGLVLVELLRSDGLTHRVIPWGQLGAFVLVAGFFGVLAAIGPARRASRMAILEAISEE